jgi:ElaB/YqjD/DUF883 family membrane-anchored ribosome-binding protein
LGDVGQPRVQTQQSTGANALNQVKETASDLASRSTDALSNIGTKAKDSASAVSSRFQRMMHENPLALAVGAAVVGVALGLMLPETDKEREMMGPARDRLGERVQDTAERVKDAAVEAGREVKETVKDEVAYRGPEVKNAVKDAASTVKQQVKESAGRVAREAKKE